MSKNFKIIYKNGLHARIATNLVNEAMKYDCEITIFTKEKKANLKSIMGLLSLAIAKDDEISISCFGDDDEQAIAGLSYLMSELRFAIEI